MLPDHHIRSSKCRRRPGTSSSRSPQVSGATSKSTLSGLSPSRHHSWRHSWRRFWRHFSQPRRLETLWNHSNLPDSRSPRSRSLMRLPLLLWWLLSLWSLMLWWLWWWRKASNWGRLDRLLQQLVLQPPGKSFYKMLVHEMWLLFWSQK